MAYAMQLQVAMERLDQSLAQLRTLIKRGEQNKALQFMDAGELKERYEELQNIVILSQTNPLGARGTAQTGTL